MSEERKIYPITEEIIEAGERTFWKRIEELKKERSKQKKQSETEADEEVEVRKQGVSTERDPIDDEKIIPQ